MRVKPADGSGIFHFYVNLVTKLCWVGLQLVSEMGARCPVSYSDMQNESWPHYER